MTPTATTSRPSTSSRAATTTRAMSRAAFEHTLASAKRTILLREIAMLAIDSFRLNKVRFALTALGMVIGSASLILVVTIGLTGKNYAMKLLENIGPNMVEVEYAGGSSGSVGEYRNDLLTIDDEHAVDTEVPAVAASSPMLEIHDRVSFGGGLAKDVLVLGVSPAYREVRHLVVTTGRFFDETDEATHTKAAVVTIPFATQMFGSPEAAINQTVQLSGMPITIVGTFKESVPTFGMSEVADQTILIPYSVARYFTGTDKVKQIFFSIRDKNDIPFATKDIIKTIQSRHQPNSVYTANTLVEILRVAGQIADGLTVMLLLLAAVTLAVGGIGIMNIMLANVRSRIREIGIRKAMGATAREIKLQFLMEAVFISLAGGIVGVILGIAPPLAARFFTDYKIPLSPWSVVIALATSVLVGAIFGTLPATRAAQLDPVESLKYE
ncbi:MAG TPA: ABC transporter permease [Acidobacteriaceae bacterium]|jgi:putative ABC transport system permease protein